MSKYRLGKKRSKEARAKISEGRMGIEFSEEHMKNLSKSWIYENHNNAEINAKKSRTSTGKINIKIYRCIAPDGTEYITERGLSDFCREMNLTQALMSKVSLGQRAHHKGWKCTLY